MDLPGSTHPCPVGACTRNCSTRVLMCRAHWSMVRGGDDGALCREVYDTVAAYNDNPNSETRDAMEVSRNKAIAKAEARHKEIHG